MDFEVLYYWVSLNPFEHGFDTIPYLLVHLQSAGHVDRHTGQLHLDNVQHVLLEVVHIEVQLIVGHQCVPMLLIGVPSCQAICQVVPQEFIHRYVLDVFDVLTHSIVAGELLALVFQTELVTCTGVGGQVGDQLGTVPIPQHHFHPVQQTFCVTNMLHEQLVDQHGNVIADVVVHTSVEVRQEELPKQFPHWFIHYLHTVWS